MLKLIFFSKKRISDVEAELIDESNRKKSHNMLYATSAANDIIEQMKQNPTLANSMLDVIFCTGEGEIAQTFEFYSNMANGERARPLVFQNSLHNSTLGALSLAVSHIASGTTVSNGDLSFEMALDMALATTSPNPILIVGTDVYVDKVLELRKQMYHDQVELISGACAGLFIPQSSPLFEKFNAPQISDIKIKMLDKAHEESFSSFYPANGLEEIYEGLKTSTHFTFNRPKNYQIEINSYAE